MPNILFKHSEKEMQSFNHSLGKLSLPLCKDVWLFPKVSWKNEKDGHDNLFQQSGGLRIEIRYFLSRAPLIMVNTCDVQHYHSSKF